LQLLQMLAQVAGRQQVNPKSQQSWQASQEEQQGLAYAGDGAEAATARLRARTNKNRTRSLRIVRLFMGFLL